MKIKAIIIITLSLCLSSCTQQNEYNNYINSPKKGDIYEVKLDKKEDSFYSIYKVKKSTSDSIIVFTTEYNINQKDKLHLLNKDGLFEKRTKSFSKDHIKKLLNEKIIFSIKRNKN